MKKDLKQFEYLATKDDVANAVRESEERLGKKLDNVLTAVDGLTKKVSDFQTELLSNQTAHARY